MNREYETVLFPQSPSLLWHASHAMAYMNFISYVICLFFQISTLLFSSLLFLSRIFCMHSCMVVGECVIYGSQKHD